MYNFRQHNKAGKLSLSARLKVIAYRIIYSSGRVGTCPEENRNKKVIKYFWEYTLKYIWNIH